MHFSSEMETVIASIADTRESASRFKDETAMPHITNVLFGVEETRISLYARILLKLMDQQNHHGFEL
jgi:hypothetical protein